MTSAVTEKGSRNRESISAKPHSNSDSAEERDEGERIAHHWVEQPTHEYGERYRKQSQRVGFKLTAQFAPRMDELD